MIKLPEPDLSFDNGVEAHSEAQLKQAVRAALEEAAEKFEAMHASGDVWISTIAIAEHLKKQQYYAAIVKHE